MEKYFHLFANGDDARNFITSEKDFKAAFNRIAICSFLTEAVVLSASVEDTHPHILLRGTAEQCLRFKNLYEKMSLKYIVSTRGTSDGVVFISELYEIGDLRYLRNAAAYTIVQATKDGKDIMPYDYLFGTGALYFRKPWSIMPWCVSENGQLLQSQTIGSLTCREKRAYFPASVNLPDEWLVCNGFILPTNYVDIRDFERIFVTSNCFRVFISGSKAKDEDIRSQMSTVRGVALDDLEARRLCHESCNALFGKETTRHLDIGQRLKLAQNLRTNYRISYRQLSTLVKITEDELRKYIR